MRRAAAVAALLLLAPVAARAQLAPLATLDTYRIDGCLAGTLRYDGFTPVQGSVACFTGTATLSLLRLASPEQSGLVRFDGSVTPTFGDGFSGAGGSFDGHSAVLFDYAAPGCPTCLASGVLEPRAGGVLPGTPSAIFAVIAFPTDGADVAAIRNVRASVSLVYGLPGTPPGEGAASASGTLTFTATPEPATLLLTTIGGLALVGTARRRRAQPVTR